MNRLRIRHVTGFHYEGDVTASYNEARMLPASSDGQLVLFSHLDIAPQSAQHHYSDYFGTRVTSFELLEQHHDLALTADSLVEVRERPTDGDTIGWDALPALLDRSVSLVEGTRQTRLTAPPEEVAERARELAAAHAPSEAAREICDWVHEKVEYMSGVTGVHTTAAEAWQDQRGVCQDIAHLAIGALRTAGIPARYVSGYLHPRPDAEIGETVAGESHAWVEWFDGGWRGYDPTNAIAIGSVAGALAAARRGRPRLRVIALAAFGIFASMLVAALMPTFELFAVALVPVGFTAMTMVTSANAYVQTTTRASIRGRVLALYLTIFMGGTPLGAPLIGLVANEFGPRWALIAGALGGLLAAIIAVSWMRSTRNLRVGRRHADDDWWRLTVAYDGDDYSKRLRDVDTATQELAVIDAETRKS